MTIRPLFLACVLLLPAAGARAAKEEDSEETPGHTLEVGLKGSKGREAGTSDFDWGPTISYGLLTSPEHHAIRIKYELEASYNDAITDTQNTLASQSTRVRSFEFRYAKVHLLELFGFDFKKRILIVPYASGGIQHVDSRQDSRNFDEATDAFFSESKRERYWSPTFGFGAEIALNKKVSLALDYDQNAESGERRVSRLSFELKYAVFGADD